jgi:tetratricopeptide (TPR) repeat protein
LPSRYGIAAGASLAAAFGLATTQMTPAYASAEAYRSWAADYVLSSPPRNPREAHLSHLTRARRFRDELRNDEALQELLAADRIAPWLPEHQWQLADVLLALGRPKEAVAVLERLLSPEFRFDPAGIEQRKDMGNDSMERLSAVDTWRFLARAREAADDEAGARAARSTADAVARLTQQKPVPTGSGPTKPPPGSTTRPD